MVLPWPFSRVCLLYNGCGDIYFVHERMVDLSVCLQMACLDQIPLPDVATIPNSIIGVIDANMDTTTAYASSAITSKCFVVHRPCRRLFAIFKRRTHGQFEGIMVGCYRVDVGSVCQAGVGCFKAYIWYSISVHYSRRYMASMYMCAYV